MNSFIVEFWSRIYGALRAVSLFALVRRLFPKLVTGAFVDAWVLGHTVLAGVCVFLVSIAPQSWFSMALVAYGGLRVFEVTVYQVNVLLFDEYRAFKVGDKYELIGYRRMVILLLHNYAEIILWLACTYTVLAQEFDFKWQQGRDNAWGSVYSSFITMTTFGEFDLAPKSGFAAFVLLFHATIGLFMTLLSLARFISLIPVPKTRDAIELKQIEAQQAARPPEPPPR